MSPKYQILSKTPMNMNGKDGTLVEVRFVPIINGISDEDHAETQEYFVASDEDLATVLSRAAWNHEDEKKDQLTPDNSSPPEPEKDALPKNQL